MHKVTVVLEDYDEYKNDKQDKVVIEINDSLFEIALRKGLIEKIGEEYVFIGDYEELLAFKE
ncbi:MAG: hypothetical protein DRN24_04990 [Thermoplasmata archaeon]|nr:MAG: hypothetical protein DRN24_04990 [Thermoplasmata archaeon]